MSTPGFSLRESPPGVQRLGFTWFDADKTHRFVEFARLSSHPLMVAQQLEQMADAIKERYFHPLDFGLHTPWTP